MQYYLMNKNKHVANIDVKRGAFGDEYTLSSVDGILPYGMTSVDSWLESRKASKHNRRLRELMASCGCEKTDGYIKITHAATLNDTYWVKAESENVKWENISLYQNQFNETISKLAFEGVGLYGLQISTTSPEFSTSGTFRKCWKKEGNDIYLYKRGTDGAFNSGLEPYCEALSSELAVAFCGNAVSYQVVRLHGEIASKCKLFTDEEKGFLPSSLVVGTDKSDSELFEKYCEDGSEDLFRRMVIVDALTFNVDRHRSNHGFLIDNDTQQLLEMAPVFDFNLALLPYVTMDEFENIGDKLLQYEPKIGSDFTYVAQSMLTSKIRSDLVNLKGFHFSFDGDERFTKKRINALEHLIDRHIDAILGKEHIYTVDVFPSQKRLRENKLKRVAEEIVATMDFVNSVNTPNENDSNFSVDFDGDDGRCLYAEFSSDGDFVLAIDDNGTQILPDDLSKKLSVSEHVLLNRIRMSLKKSLAKSTKDISKEKETEKIEKD